MAVRKPSGLGRGLSALLGDDALQEESSGGILHIPVSQIETNSAQPRKNFDEVSLSELASSIQQHGIIQPLTVRRLASGYYQIVMGERRWRAARIAGLDEIPVIVIKADDKKAAELALVENLQREDLNPIEEATGYQMLIEEFQMSQNEAAARVGCSRSAITNALRLLSLAAEVQNMVNNGQLTAGHARALVTLSPEKQIEAANTITENSLNVRQTEALVKRLSQEKQPVKAEKPEESETGLPVVDYMAEAQQDLSTRMGRKVRIVNGRKKGRIELEYYGLDDLNALLDALSLIHSAAAGSGERI